MSTLQEELQLNFLAVKGSVATFVVAAYMKSVPMIYNGKEIGYDKRINYFAKTPIDWSTAYASMLPNIKK